MSFIRRLRAPIAIGLSLFAVGLSVEAKAQDRSLWLYNGQGDVVSGYFTQGEVIQASCDVDCLDLDLYLYDLNGNLVDQDSELDDVPVVVAPYEGDFVIEVTMPNCTHSSGCEAWVSSEYGF